MPNSSRVRRSNDCLDDVTSYLRNELQCTDEKIFDLVESTCVTSTEYTSDLISRLSDKLRSAEQRMSEIENVVIEHFRLVDECNYLRRALALCDRQRFSGFRTDSSTNEMDVLLNRRNLLDELLQQHLMNLENSK